MYLAEIRHPRSMLDLLRGKLRQRANTVAIATLAYTLIGPSAALTRVAAASTASASATSVGIVGVRTP